MSINITENIEKGGGWTIILISLPTESDTNVTFSHQTPYKKHKAPNFRGGNVRIPGQIE